MGFAATLCGLYTEIGEEEITARELDERFDKKPGTLKKLTGIERIHRFPADVDIVNKSALVVIEALETAGIALNDVDGIISSSSAPVTDYIMPGYARAVGQKLRLSGIPMMHTGIGCTGGMQAMQFARSLATTDYYEGRESNYVVVVGDQAGRVLNSDDWTTFPLFSEGVSAIVLTNRDVPGYRITKMKNAMINSEFGDIHAMRIRNPFTTGHDFGPCYYEMDREDVFSFGVKEAFPAMLETLELERMPKYGYFIPHQANSKMISLIAKLNDIDKNSIYMDGIMDGNCLASSVFLGLHDAMYLGLIDPNQCVVMGSFGADNAVSAAYLHPYHAKELHEKYRPSVHQRNWLEGY